MNIGIASMYTSNHVDLANITWTNKSVYAKKHGYECFLKTTNFSDTIHVDKLRHLLDILNKNQSIDWVWWLDNDAIVTNFSITLESIVDNDWHVIMSTDCHSLNTGSFFIKNSNETKKWLEFLIKLSNAPEYRDDKRWKEQQMVIDTYIKYRDIIKIVPQKTFNSYQYSLYGLESLDLLGYDGEWSPGDFVLHWPALPNQTRLQLFNLIKPYIKDI